MLTSVEVAQLLHVHPKHIYRLLRQGLPGHRVGRGHWRFHRAEVLAWFDDRDRGSTLMREEVTREELKRDEVTRGELTHGTDRTHRDATHDTVADLEVKLAPGPPLRAGPNRVWLGRVRSRWVAHAMGDRGSRCADALVSAEAPAPRPEPHTRVEPLCPPATLAANLLVAGCAPVLGVILDRLQGGHPGRIHWLPANSTTSLDLLVDGFVHVAGVHLEDPAAGTSHDSLVRDRFPAARAHLVRLLRWRTGLVLRPGTPGRALGDWVSPGWRWVLREPGAGARRVLERVLGRLGTSVASLDTVRVATRHRDVAQAVALGVADVGVAVEAVAREAGLRFVPLAEEGFDLIVPHDIATERPVARMLDALDDRMLRREIGALGSYDTSAMGHATTP